MIRKRIKPGTPLAVKLSVRERDLVVEKAFLEPEMEATLRQAAHAGAKLVVRLNLDDIDELLGCVAAEANHCDDAKVRRLLYAICDRLGRLLDQFTDEPPVMRPVPEPPRPLVTAKQGQYLAFIHYYTKVHRAAPAETDLQRFFKVSPPTVHAMILALERRGFIERTPGKARSIKVTVAASQLPELA